MPRPGPRPYECIRRAWHSDSHHPLRGRLIQEIFRIADEIHNPTTRRNKEWQKKLPLVVLRAEEILYSKANSEADYLDLKTLRSRMEDAINTLIRRDESTEHGQYLEPCVEAALYVGCLPKKASRGQRHNSRFCSNSNQRMSTSSTIPAIVKCNDYNGSSLVGQANTQESRFTSAEYCVGVSSSFPSIDCQNYPVIPIHTVSGCLSSVVCSPGVGNTPYTNAATFSLPNIHSKGNTTPLSFNHGMPSVCNGLPQHHTCPSASQKGQVMHLPEHQTRMETRLLCMPVLWSRSSELTNKSTSNPWCVADAVQMEALNDPSIGILSCGELSPVVAKMPSTFMGSSSQFQVHSTKQKNSNHTGANPIPYTTELCSLDGTQGTYKSIQNTATGDLSAETNCKRSDESACDLHLRLGPSSSLCFEIATDGSCDVEDLESSNSRGKTQADDDALENLKVNDSFGSGSGSDSNQEFHCFSPSLNSGFNIPDTFPTENMSLSVDRHAIRQAVDIELACLKRRRCEYKSLVNQDVQSADKQENVCELKMGLGLSLFERSSDV